ncbi:hypothetical protein MBLNU459_g8146t1 [Dothideomycetes sp. NU459]
MVGPNSASILQSGARSFFNCDERGNTLVSTFLRDRGLDHKTLWASFVAWCLVIADRQANPAAAASVAAEETAVMACLCAWPTDAAGLVEVLAWYHDRRCIHGEVSAGRIKSGEHGSFPPSARLIHRASASPLSIRALSRAERNAQRREHRDSTSPLGDMEAVAPASLAAQGPAGLRSMSGDSDGGSSSSSSSSGPQTKEVGLPDFSSALTMRPKRLD